MRGRYLAGSKEEKGKILDEFVRVTGYHRKAEIRLLRCSKVKVGRRQGRPKRYDSEVLAGLKVAWEASDHLCSKRLQPFLPELVDRLRRCGEISLTARVEGELCQMSA